MSERISGYLGINNSEKKEDDLIKKMARDVIRTEAQWQTLPAKDKGELVKQAGYVDEEGNPDFEAYKRENWENYPRK